MTARFRWIALVGLFVFAGVGGAHGQSPKDDHFNGLHLTGLINDFTTPAFGSWEVHGAWSLDVTGGPNAANFTAALTMERSDLFFGLTPTANPNTLATRNAHTHHISVVNSTVTAIPGGFRVNGTAVETVVTGNGAGASFETNPPSSTVQINITGGSLVTFSNITLTFGGAAASHFGLNPLAGVVETVK
jgi:hypothetical protein